jgi:anti-sigma B factor antagonist
MINLIDQHANYIVAVVNATEASLNNAEDFKQQLITLLNQYQNNIIIDLKQVEYVDSSFLGALVAVLKHAITLKKEVLLVELHKDVYNLMALIRLDKVFKIYSTLPDAVQSLS